MSVHRITLFKVHDESHIDAMLDKLSTLKQDAKKDGKNYVERVAAGRIVQDPRSQGYNFCLETEFASLEDMKYYDEVDPAHGELKALMKGKAALPPFVVYMSDYKAL